MCALSSQVAIGRMRGEPLILIKQIANYCDAHRDKFDIRSEDLFDKYLMEIRDAETASETAFGFPHSKSSGEMTDTNGL